MGKESRNSNFELLRIVAIFFVVMFHYTVCHSSALREQTDISLNLVVAYALGSWGQFGVSCFFIISAWFMVGNKRPFKCQKVLDIILQNCFYAFLLFAVAHLLKIEDASLEGVIKSSLSFVTGSYWFVRAYFMMILFSPVMNIVIERLKKEELLRLIITMSLIPIAWFFIWGFPLSELYIPLFTYLFVGWLKSNENNFFENYRYYGALLCFVIIVCAEVFSIPYTRNLVYKFTDINSIVMIIAAIFVFYIFKNIQVKSKIINYLAKSSFAVYLLHEGLLSDYIRLNVFKIDSWYAGSNLFGLYLLLVFIILYAICVLLELIRKPLDAIIKKMLFRVLSKPMNTIDNLVNVNKETS